MLPEFDLAQRVGRKIALQKYRRAIVLCVVDVTDFDGSLPRCPHLLAGACRVSRCRLDGPPKTLPAKRVPKLTDCRQHSPKHRCRSSVTPQAIWAQCRMLYCDQARKANLPGATFGCCAGRRYGPCFHGTGTQAQRHPMCLCGDLVLAVNKSDLLPIRSEEAHD